MRDLAVIHKLARTPLYPLTHENSGTVVRKMRELFSEGQADDFVRNEDGICTLARYVDMEFHDAPKRTEDGSWDSNFLIVDTATEEYRKGIEETKKRGGFGGVEPPRFCHGFHINLGTREVGISFYSPLMDDGATLGFYFLTNPRIMPHSKGSITDRFLLLPDTSSPPEDWFSFNIWHEQKRFLAAYLKKNGFSFRRTKSRSLAIVDSGTDETCGYLAYGKPMTTITVYRNTRLRPYLAGYRGPD